MASTVPLDAKMDRLLERSGEVQASLVGVEKDIEHVKVTVADLRRDTDKVTDALSKRVDAIEGRGGFATWAHTTAGGVTILVVVAALLAAALRVSVSGAGVTVTPGGAVPMAADDDDGDGGTENDGDGGTDALAYPR